ncbi:MAG: HK97 gp10 family phage protein [Beijerinckiaceae bacterium]|nr:HK97 gp10 family phage protein [Beijerinckiaceae bacterium]
MKMGLGISGFKELDAALGELPKATARNALRRVLVMAGQPIAESARQMAPDDPKTFAGDLRRSITVSASLKNKVGSSEYAAVMRGGGTKGEARAALIDARRAASGGSFAVVYVGPSGKRWGSMGHLPEFGTSKMAAQPYLRPAFDARSSEALNIIRTQLKDQIEKAAARYAKRQARKAAKAAG